MTNPTEVKSKQEGIEEKRETILNFIRTWGVIKHPYGSKDAEGCLAMLSDLGVVIKVDRELPIEGLWTPLDLAVEPLIKDE